jgi:hypothetical protein
MPSSTTPTASDTPPRAPDPALDARLDRIAEVLRSRNIEVVVVDTAAEARHAILGLLPERGEVHWGKSKTIDDLGISSHLLESTTLEALRPKYMQLDRATQGREIRRMTATPDTMLGSVAAVTEDGALVAASATGSQLAAYASGAGRVILVVGSQKIVRTVDEAIRRIEDVVYPYEDEQVQQRLGVHTRLEKVLIMYGEWNPGRTTVVLVREPVGV